MYFPFKLKVAPSGKFLHHCTCGQYWTFPRWRWTRPPTQGKGSIYLHCLKIISISLLGFSLHLPSCPSVLPFHLFLFSKKGIQSLTPTTQGVAGRPVGDSYQLLVAVVGSVTVTCVTILLALLALFFIRKTLLNRRRTFTYQSGSVRDKLSLGYHHIWSDKAQMCFETILLSRTLINVYLLPSLWLFIPPGWGDYSAV